VDLYYLGSQAYTEKSGTFRLSFSRRIEWYESCIETLPQVYYIQIYFIVNRGCGKCPSKTCETCNKNRCNDGQGLKYYCKSKKGEKEMIKCDKPECYIKALNEAKNG